MIDQLLKIKDSTSNVVELKRETNHLLDDISMLMASQLKFQLSGNQSYILSEIIAKTPIKIFSPLYEDIKTLLECYTELTNVEDYEFLLSTINDNMCSKFHYDMNRLRLLCTYSGPGTLWVDNSNVNWTAIHEHQTNDAIVVDEKKTHQAQAGSIVILKGAQYNKSEIPPVVHRSPTIEGSNKTRLLVRIDTKRKDFIS